MSLKGKKKERATPTNERFELVDVTEVEVSKQPLVPANTQKATKWAIAAFEDWVSQRNQRSDDQCPPDLLLTDDGELLCKWLCVFVTELRKSDGSEYTPRSIAQLLAGLQRYINARKKEPLKIVDGRSPVFKDLHNVLDRRYRELHAQGIGATKRQSEILSHSEEEQLWETETLGVDSPLALQYAVFFNNGLIFVLRGGQEHRELKMSQLKFKSVPDPEHPGEDIVC